MDELASYIAMLTPEQAATEEALLAAAVHAATALRDEMPLIKASVRVHPDTAPARNSEIARAVLKRALALRNGWLIEHGAFVRG